MNQICKKGGWPIKFDYGHSYMTFIKKMCWLARQLHILTWLFLGVGNGLQITAGCGLTTEPYNKDLMKNVPSHLLSL